MAHDPIKNIDSFSISAKMSMFFDVLLVQEGRASMCAEVQRPKGKLRFVFHILWGVAAFVLALFIIAVLTVPQLIFHQ